MGSVTFLKVKALLTGVEETEGGGTSDEEEFEAAVALWLGVDREAVAVRERRRSVFDWLVGCYFLSFF